MAVAEKLRGQRTRSRNNRERIVEIAVRLLNEHGEAAVGTARIAQELQISPGNLYYHFENREEIVRAIFPRIRDALHDALTPDPGTDGAEQLARHYIGGFRVMYEFRFFFSGLPQLLRADDQLRRDYLELEGVELERDPVNHQARARQVDQPTVLRRARADYNEHVDDVPLLAELRLPAKAQLGGAIR